MGTPRRSLAVGVVLLLVAGCASRAPDLDELLHDAGSDTAERSTGDPAEAEADARTDAGRDFEAEREPEPEPEPEPDDDPFAIPEEIDEAYVDLVTNELLAISSETLRRILSRDPGEGITDEDSLGIRAAFSGPRLIKISEDYLRYSNNEESRIGFLPPEELGTIRWQTEELVSADESCIVAFGYYDITEVAIEPYPRDLYSVVSLSPDHDGGRDTDALNPTVWRIHDINLAWVGGEPIPPEDWDRVDLDTTLEMTCDGAEIS